MHSDTASHWVFAYGSLIWRPDFAFVRREPAQLKGFHRALCVLSHKYRGTCEQRGLVFGLDEGGHCNGIAYQVKDSDWPDVYRYLTAREMVTRVYLERRLDIDLSASGLRVTAMTYVVDRAHPQYAGSLTQDEVLGLVRQGVGDAGRCIDYVRNTARQLHAFGIPDAELDKLVALL